MHSSSKSGLKLLFLASALAAGAAHAGPGYLTSAGQPVRSAANECWRTASWTSAAATRECDAQLAAAPAAPAAAESPAPTTAESPAAALIAAVAEAPRLAPAPERVTFATEVLFDFDGAELRADGRKALDELARNLLASELESVAAVAHADRVGDAAYNERLSARRAAVIQAYLMEKGVPGALMRIEAKGEREPVTGGRCDALGAESRLNAKLVACLQPDRRVEIEVAGRTRAAARLPLASRE